MILNLKDQLGNQLFSYASCKCICKETAKRFRWFTNGTDIVNSFDTKYGNTIDGGAFPNIDFSERIVPLDRNDYDWIEPWPRKSNYIEEVYNFKEDAFVRGHFQTERYFVNHREDVLHWFDLDERIKKQAETEKKRITEGRNNIVLVSVHVRMGKDYYLEGRVLSKKYYKNAIRRIQKEFEDKKIVAVLFSDSPKAKKWKFPDVEMHYANGTLFEDFAFMQICDVHVISNSTFAWWGAWLDKKEGMTICPSKYYISHNEQYPIDIFPEKWTKVQAQKSMRNHLRTITKIVNKIKNIIRRKK